MEGTAGGCLFACHPPGLLLQPPRYHCAPVLLAIFGSQAQKYAGDINNSFFEFGQEDRALAPASGAALGGLGLTGIPGLRGTPSTPLPSPPNAGGGSPKLSTVYPFTDNRKEKTPEIWRQP